MRPPVTLCHGTVLVVRIGATTIDSVSRAMQSLCQNNVLASSMNERAARAVQQYTYYHSYYTPKEDKEDKEGEKPPMGRNVGRGLPAAGPPAACAVSPQLDPSPRGACTFVCRVTNL